ncbi:MAG: decarboxylating 6-phosphogluconate dehydrogenase [Ignavibacteriales bacterium]|jgi:6-phosphogluconate dehydrogenase (decarboxylating) (EC 1.1.1.44)|nr:MAG: decarboxylating 6-phosphogluconate dehydrogenase [Ignavibacteriaceae bacterium]MBW7872794.1 decarboxylating 6-phosphogluconate dehydrogenase [Ignavibacteria bacterium]MCZ2143514.1 decarboxylating 6-phosphogluconate dehydrogenase [Ignavibacteriales bacterium]OQY74127.1 MAG: 6-phosphogluconate dehydrogenase (decarboxylating) [Ignavibacteriales bacterium UTCHB3]MBV6444391.1 6-phosphogluconate dehydrogenase, NAD(+)-dependent, decarboxylating [Ignavibacteriaceae bacterium]
MKIGFVGLGKMGANMVERLLRAGHEVVVYNRSKEKIKIAVEKGAIGSDSIEDMCGKLEGKKIVWLMVPSGKPVDENIDEVEKYLNQGDIIVDGGNSYWRDTQARHARVAELGFEYVDCGTSGGIWGLQNGYCLMYGGHKYAVDHLLPIFEALAPEGGHAYCGSTGAGHFVKMVHNGIEYGMMQAYAEGFEIMEKSPFDIDLEKVTGIWQYGSVVRSWLLELANLAFKEDPKLEHVKGYVADSGEGRWTVQTAIDFDVPAHVITTSLFNRFQSRQDESFAMKTLSALRNKFGGHAMKTKD